ncbi:hypothetical protein [Acidaminobacter hydrogenoformans]|uniref:Uncharacterized protein n=1 Tax=Acidaminobacter hydrogenoformans DSM 2784 TaxID=1120920 RepID=A0A1G5S5N2_9FIRM|nr:hypothetical protein [Acidaminobacter hydrogenoformans]SCZ81041.1 hypothetical protein SAMN03080599_02577 [Acidaminobacter hydrogenoformans DSM 2784]
MVSLLRNGPRMLFIGTSKRCEFIDFMNEKFKAEILDVDVIFDKSDEFNTIIYLFSELKPNVNKSDVTDALLIRNDVAKVLCRLVEQNGSRLIDAIRPAPQTVLMRAVGDMEQMLLRIQRDFGGKVGSFNYCIESGCEATTIIGLTDKPLSRTAKFSDMHHNFLSLNQDYAALHRDLTMEAFRYLNSGLDKKDWHELEIRIYDVYGAFQLHHERLMEVLDSLELGIVIGEAWSKDYPKFLFPVEVYSVHFLTFVKPSEFKRIIFGLEHLSDGTRIVDYDLYIKNKKVYWREIMNNKMKTSREVEALKARSEVYSRLDEKTKVALAELEERILGTRK